MTLVVPATVARMTVARMTVALKGVGRKTIPPATRINPLAVAKMPEENVVDRMIAVLIPGDRIHVRRPRTARKPGDRTAAVEKTMVHRAITSAISNVRSMIAMETITGGRITEGQITEGQITEGRNTGGQITGGRETIGTGTTGPSTIGRAREQAVPMNVMTPHTMHHVMAVPVFTNGVRFTAAAALPVTLSMTAGELGTGLTQDGTLPDGANGPITAHLTSQVDIVMIVMDAIPLAETVRNGTAEVIATRGTLPDATITVVAGSLVLTATTDDLLARASIAVSSDIDRDLEANNLLIETMSNTESDRPRTICGTAPIHQPRVTHPRS